MIDASIVSATIGQSRKHRSISQRYLWIRRYVCSAIYRCMKYTTNNIILTLTLAATLKTNPNPNRPSNTILYTLYFGNSVYVFIRPLLETAPYSTTAGERSIAISLSVCLCICLCVCEQTEHISGTTGPIFNNFLCRSDVALDQSSSSSVAISYVLPVLWMTSCLRRHSIKYHISD